MTTDPAPITLFSPMVTPGRIVTFAPIHALLPMVTGSEYWVTVGALRRSGRIGCPVVTIVTFGPIITSSPMVTTPSSTSVRLKFA